MLAFSLQFGGVENAALLTTLAGAISLALLGYGLWQLLLRRELRRGTLAILCGVAAGALVGVAAGEAPMNSPGGQAVWLILLAGLIVLAVGVFYSAVYAYLGRRRVATLLLLRFLAILALLLILFKPAVSFAPGGPQRRLALPVLVDRSASMDTIDYADLPSRYRQAAEALAAQGDRLSENFRVGWHHFARQVQAVERGKELSALAPAGAEEGTDMALAIRRASAGGDASELAGIILISDGLHNASASSSAGIAPLAAAEASDVLAAARESPVPIQVIGVGSEAQQAGLPTGGGQANLPAAGGQRNVRLLSVDAPIEAVRNNVAAVSAKLRLTAWMNIPTRVSLAEDGREIASRQVLADSNAQDVQVQLDWTPGEPPAGSQPPDVRRLKLLIEPNPAEATPDDNAAELHVLVVQPSIRVLYVEGTLRPEYKFLRRGLASDPNVKFVSLVRYRENQFLSQGSIDGRRLEDLPRSDEELALFDVLILGDLDRTFLTAEQMERIRQWVYQGKALLMLGGRNSFGPGGYGGTPIESALPVLCGSRSAAQETTRFVPRLTAAGLASPIFAGLERHFGGPSGAAAEPLPELLGCVQVPAAKPHAQVLAIHPTRRGPEGGESPLVVLAVHNYGKGRAAAFTADTTWQWFLRGQVEGPARGSNPYYRFWGQLIRYLAGVEAQQRLTAPSVIVRLDSPYLRQGEPLKIAAQVKNASGQAEGEASVSATVRKTGDAGSPAGGGPAGGAPAEPVQVSLVASKAGEGMYEATVRPGRPGRYAVTVTTADKAGQKLATDELPVVVAPYARETDRLARDGALLKAIAEASGGRYAEISRLPDVIDELIQRQQSRLRPAQASPPMPLYHFTALFLAFVALLTVEWLLRRNWQLQ